MKNLSLVLLSLSLAGSAVAAPKHAQHAKQTGKAHDRVVCDVARIDDGKLVTVASGFAGVKKAIDVVVRMNRSRPSVDAPMVFATCSIETAATDDYVYPGLKVHGEGE